MNEVSQRKDYRGVPNLNFIPLEYRRRILPSWQMLVRLQLVWMIVVGAFIVTNLYQQRSALQASMDSAQRKIQQADRNLAAANAKKEEAKKLQATIESLKNQNEVMKQDWGLVVGQADWSRVMAALFHSKPEDVQLRSVTKQETMRVTVAGTAVDYATLLQYRNQLLSSPVISRVISLSSSKAASSVSFSLVAEVKPGGK